MDQSNGDKLMTGRVSAESLRVAVTSFMLATGSSQILADTNGSPSSGAADAGPTHADIANPAQVFTRMFNGASSSDSNVAAAAHTQHRHPHHIPAPDSISASASTNAASSASQSTTRSIENTAPPAVTESNPASNSAQIVNTFSAIPADSRVNEWLPTGGNAALAQKSISTSARIDLIIEKLGNQATIDFNSRILEPDGMIAFHAIDNQTGQRETVRIDRSGDIQLQPGWPE